MKKRRPNAPLAPRVADSLVSTHSRARRRAHRTVAALAESVCGGILQKRAVGRHWLAQAWRSVCRLAAIDPIVAVARRHSHPEATASLARPFRCIWAPLVAVFTRGVIDVPPPPAPIHPTPHLLGHPMAKDKEGPRTIPVLIEPPSESESSVPEEMSARESRIRARQGAMSPGSRSITSGGSLTHPSHGSHGSLGSLGSLGSGSTRPSRRRMKHHGNSSALEDRSSVLGRMQDIERQEVRGADQPFYSSAASLTDRLDVALRPSSPLPNRPRPRPSARRAPSDGRP